MLVRSQTISERGDSKCSPPLRARLNNSMSDDVKAGILCRVLDGFLSDDKFYDFAINHCLFIMTTSN